MCFLHQYKTFYRILKEAERREKLEIAKREKEVKHQLFMEEKKRKQEEKQEEKMKKLQEIEMKRQQNAIMKEQVTIFRFLLSVGNIYWILMTIQLTLEATSQRIGGERFYHAAMVCSRL